MKYYLAPLIISAVAMSAYAAVGTDAPRLESAAGSVKTVNIKSPASSSMKKLGAGVYQSSDRKIKRLDNRQGLKTVNPMLRKKSPVVKANAEAAPLYESFESWDGQTQEWLPEGWTRQTAVEDLSTSWTPSAAVGVLSPTDGKYMFAINYGENQDEWLISPMIETKDGMSISFSVYLEPAFLFSMDNVDWDAMEFIGEPEVAATLQVMVKAEGDAEWTTLHDFVDDYKGYGLSELMMMTPSALESKNISLGEFAGKKLQIALRYVGTDGNTMAVDEVSVGYPTLEGVNFSEPFNIQYWGFERDSDLSSISLSIAQFPVFSPITWTNNTYIPDAEFSWKYCDPETTEMVDGGSEETLTVSYAPDYTSDNTKRNNMFYPPVLTATAQFATPTQATSPYNFLQAGGRPEYLFSDGTTFEGSLLPFSYREQGLSIVAVESDKYGDLALPIFGHDANTNKYWLDYTLNGSEPSEGDDVQLDGILNFIYPSEQALVVNGGDVYAKGNIAADAELTLSIYPLDETYVFDPDTQKPLATAKCLGKDIIMTDLEAGRNTNLCIPFDFESPVVLKAGENAVAYVVYLTGFNSDKVEYFVPLQSYYPHPDGLCHGWITKRIRVQGNADYRFSATPLAYYENDLGEMYSAFAIGLRAEHPWLTTEVKEISLPSDGTPVEVALGSYYDGSKLSVAVPTGVVAEITGRYDECKLVVKHDASEVIAEGNVVVSGPGVELTIPLSQGFGTGIKDIVANDAKVIGVYDLTGRRVNAAEAGTGVYIVKFADGTAKKITVK